MTSTIVEGSNEISVDGERLSLFGDQTRTKMVGLAIFCALLVSGIVTFVILIGLTPIVPTIRVATTAGAINGVLALGLIYLIWLEIRRILRSRKKGRAASRLHVRIITLFSLVAAVPAIIVALVAGVTLDLGLDRWFELRTKNIVESSVAVAEAYVNESRRVMSGNTFDMARGLDVKEPNFRRLLALDKRRFEALLAVQARARGFASVGLVRRDGTEIISYKRDTDLEIPQIPQDALAVAEAGDLANIPRGETNLIGAVMKLRSFENAYLYSVTSLSPAVISALAETIKNSDEYRELENNRLPVQVTFAILYTGLCLIVLLAAIWMGVGVADRIVSPIRRLIFAADSVSKGDLDVEVDTHRSEGDLRFLSNTFNVMVSELKSQRSELVQARDEMDQRARFTEAVLSGVSAGVMGVDAQGTVRLANSSAEQIFGSSEDGSMSGQELSDFAIELAAVLEAARKAGRSDYRETITLAREGRERTLNVQVTREQEAETTVGYVVTIDDITDLVAAQRNTAWSDVARRIAHEIKNPLTPIQLSAERIRRRYGKQVTEDKEVFDQCVDTIVRQVGDIGRMVDEFSSFARMPTPEISTGDIAKVVHDTVFLQKVGYPNITFETDYREGQIICNFDQRMLSQALINVIKNAAEAIEAVSPDENRPGRIRVACRQVENHAEITVADNGIGLPEENRQRLLEPYMTTREKGTGLGLAIVRKILEDQGGSIELMDAPEVAKGGHGAMMRFTLPLAGDVPAISDERDDNSPEPTPVSKTKTAKRKTKA